MWQSMAKAVWCMCRPNPQMLLQQPKRSHISISLLP